MRVGWVGEVDLGLWKFGQVSNGTFRRSAEASCATLLWLCANATRSSQRRVSVSEATAGGDIYGKEIMRGRTG
jgi:hypothetical protein